MIAPARRAAFEALRAVDAGRLDLGTALARARTTLADERDRALASELAIGALRWQGRIDHVIAAFSSRPLPRIDRDVLTIARLAVHQLLHLDRVPAAAVVDDAVEQVRRAGRSSAAGFVNAVLRSIVRRRHDLPLPKRPPLPRDASADGRRAALDYLSITLSHPRWLVERWLDRWSFEDVEAWLRFNNAEAPLAVRANTLVVTREALAGRLAAAGVPTRPSAWAPDGLVPSGNPLRTPLADEGLFLVQDEASQLVPLLVGARPGERVLDACAAPGGKTLALAAAGSGDAVIVAADVRRKRVELLGRTLRRFRAPQVAVIQLDARQPLPFTAVFDAVLIDAPCSGLGTIRRDPEIRWRRGPADFAALAGAQRMMLGHAAEVVRPGGRLVYATCSSEPEENEDVVTAFLADDARFRPVPADDVRALLPGRAAELVDDAGHLRTWPFRHGLEAFFGAVLERRP